jgi:hypothetical protein
MQADQVRPRFWTEYGWEQTRETERVAYFITLRLLQIDQRVELHQEGGY